MINRHTPPISTYVLSLFGPNGRQSDLLPVLLTYGQMALAAEVLAGDLSD